MPQMELQQWALLQLASAISNLAVFPYKGTSSLMVSTVQYKSHAHANSVAEAVDTRSRASPCLRLVSAVE